MLLQVRWQLPLEQSPVAFVPPHVTPQPPQFVLVLVAVSQPSVSLDEVRQLANPDAHADPGTTQPPELLHETPGLLLR